MSVKTTGAEYKRFLAEDWPEDKYMDDELLLVNGVELDVLTPIESVSDDAVITIMAGVVYQGDGDWSLETEFKRWRKAQTTEKFCVVADKGIVAAVKAAIIAAGGKVTS